MTPDAGRSDLPRGTVTLLFTDVESSTRALRTLGDRYGEALALHGSVIRGVAERCGGVEVDTQGDAFFVSFRSAGEALDAASTLQRELRDAPWPEGVGLRVRIGVHSGEPAAAPHGYVGLDVHRAARICSAAHGGQVLVSAVTRALVADGERHTFLDLGRHVLKDFDEPVRLFQLVGAGLDTDFAPLRTASSHNLPALPGPMIGRDDELDEVTGLLVGRDARIVTLVGPGGAGKSRLALEAASLAVGRRDHGVFLVRLASVEDPALVPAEIARVLGVLGGDDVAESLRDHLVDRDCLLVLDNLEHVTEAASGIAALLDDAPGVTVLATSRAPLRLAAERVIAVEPLSLDDAVALFEDRARAAGSRDALDAESREHVRALCRRLSCLPLAIEIAAARVGALSVADMVARLEPTLETEGALDRPARQRTLAATIDWSHRLLSPPRQRLAAELAVFQGRFAPEDAEDAFGATVDDLAELVRAALLRRVDERGRTRYTMLRIVREFLLARLGEGRTLDAARARRDAWLDRVVDDASHRLAGSSLGDVLDRLERLLPDLRASLGEARDRGDAARCIRLVTPLERFWRVRVHAAEARDVLRWALASDGESDPLARARGMWTLGRLAAAQGDAAAASDALGDALRLFRTAGATRDVVFALSELAWAALDRDLDEAERLAVEALDVAESGGDDRAVASALGALANVSSRRGDGARASERARECLAIRRRLDDRLLVVNALLTVGSIALASGDAAGAIGPLEECLALAREIGDALHEAGALCCLGEARQLLGDDAAARPMLLAALAAFVRMGNEPASAECLVGLAAITAKDDPGRAHGMLVAARAARARAGTAALPVERLLESTVVERTDEPVDDGVPMTVVDAALAAGVRPELI